MLCVCRPSQKISTKTGEDPSSQNLSKNQYHNKHETYKELLSFETNDPKNRNCKKTFYFRNIVWRGSCDPKGTKSRQFTSII